jgi:hypothetical protein
MLFANNAEKVYLRLLGILIEKADNDFIFGNRISREELFDLLLGKDDLTKHMTLNINEADFNIAFCKLIKESILTESRSEGSFSFYSNDFESMNIFNKYKDNKKYLINHSSLSWTITNLSFGLSGAALDSVVEIKSSLDKKREEINSKLEGLKKRIFSKNNEREIHKYIKENNLLPYKEIEHEKLLGSQNRCDFLLLNEYGEYELWELKGPENKLFKGKLNKEKIYYENLKELQKTPELTNAIEQILVYKKWLIDNCNNEKEHGLKNHIYNSKMVVVFGSSDELDDPIKLDKLNLERHSYHNLNIITYDMLFEKIKKQFTPLIG